MSRYDKNVASHLATLKGVALIMDIFHSQVVYGVRRNIILSSDGVWTFLFLVNYGGFRDDAFIISFILSVARF